MTAAIDLGIALGFGLLTGLVGYLLMLCFGILEPQRFPNTRAHIERPSASKIDLIGRHHGGAVAADLHHHERQWGAAIEAGAAASPACMGDVMCLAAVEAGTAQKTDDGGSGSGIDGFCVGHERSLDSERVGGQ